MKGNRGCTNSFKILICGTVPCMGQALCKCRRNRICLIAVVRAGSDSLLKAHCAHPASLIRLMQLTPLTFISRWENYLLQRSRDRQPPAGPRMGTTFSLVQKVRSIQLDPDVNLPLQYLGTKLSLPIQLPLATFILSVFLSRTEQSVGRLFPLPGFFQS